MASTHDSESDDVQNLLTERNTQSGSPWNTFTESELEELRKSLPNVAANVVRPPSSRGGRSNNNDPGSSDRVDILAPEWASNPMEEASVAVMSGGGGGGGGRPQEEEVTWHGAPRFDDESATAVARKFREEVRAGDFVGPTNGVCPGFMQCNLVVLPQGKEAFDFLLFCQRNKAACPLIEVCDVGSPHPNGVAKGADLRTDVPKYAIYKDGELVDEVTDATEYWPEDSVAFLIGCSFSYDGALISAGIPLRSVEQNKNVPMYKTNLKCRPAGCLSGNMVVSMKPINAMDAAKEVEITSKYPHAHGPPVCIGSPEAIGIADVDRPDWGDAVDILPNETPVFHACGVTPQSVLMDSKVPFAITHSAGYMFVTDLPSDTVV